MDAKNPGLARCPRCGAYDPWALDDPVRVVVLDLTCLEYHCGICKSSWRVPIPPPMAARWQEA